MDENPTILIVEDEEEVLAINARFLKRRNYNVLTATCLEDARVILAEHAPNLIVLDVMLPDGSGYDLCSEFRKKSDASVLFLTGKKETSDRIKGLTTGGDYYLTKPYDFDEFLAVLQSLLRREQQTKKNQTKLTDIERGCLRLETQRNRAFINDKNIGLTQKEFAVLLTLVQNEGRMLTSNELYESVWGMSANGSTKVIRNHINQIRTKLDVNSLCDFDIITTYKKGYRFEMSSKE